MRRATARSAASRNQRYRIRVRQVFPLWGRDTARGRNGRITAEQPSREVMRPDEVGEWTVLTLTAHIYSIRVVRIDRNRKIIRCPSAREESLDIAVRLESLR